MKKTVVLMLVLFSGAAQAALHDRGGGFIYDDVLDVTWAQDPDITGSISWNNAVPWADSLSLYDSVRDVTWDDWRLPSMDVNGDNTLVDCALATELACRDNELGYMYFQNGVTSSSYSPFYTGPYGSFWAGTEYAPDPTRAWLFGSGVNYNVPKNHNSHHAWAVRDGDVFPVVVEIDVDPWSPANIIKPHSNDLIYVAVLGSSLTSGDAIDFDVTQINPDSLKLGDGEAPDIALNPLYGDYDNDTNTDAAFIFRTQDAGIGCGVTELKLQGSTVSDVPFFGADTIDTRDCTNASLPFDNPSPGSEVWFGNSVSVSGNRVLVGAVYDDTTAAKAGRAYLFDRVSGDLVRTFSNPGPWPYWDYFGTSVSVSGDRVLVGALHDAGGPVSNDDTGRAYLFDAVTGNLVHTFENPSPDSGDKFGSSVSVSGDRVLVGALWDDTAGTNAGRAYLFDAVTGSLIHTFENPSPGPYADYFGGKLSVSGDRVLIGAHGDNTTGTDSGRAYLFDAVSGSLLHTLENPGLDPAGDYFGSAVSVSGDRIVVGAYRGATTGSSTPGRAYLFDAVSGNLLHTLQNSSSEGTDYFASSVSVDGDQVLVGASVTGRAFLFDAVTGNLTQILENPSPAGSDNFGSAVSVSGDNAVVGAYRDGTTGYLSGRAYLFFDGLPAQVEVTPPAGAPYDGSLHVHHQGQGALPDDIVPVVVLGLDANDGDPVDLDVALIDLASVRLGPGRASIDPASTPNLSYNHDNDGNPDALFEFRMSATGFPFNPGTGTPCFAPVVLDGTLQITGERFAGEDLTVSKQCTAQCH